MSISHRILKAGAQQRCAMLCEVSDLHEVAPRLRGQLKADVCIVGGGYLGMWTAIGLLDAEPSLNVAVIEADICGGGASGRNSGMALAYWSKVQALIEQCGSEETLRLCKASVAAIDEIAAFAKVHGFDIEFARTGWLWGATCRRQEGRWRPVIEALDDLQHQPLRELDRSGVAEFVLAEGYLSGVFDGSAATLHPAKLARGLRRVARSMGAIIFEQSPMIRLQRSSPPAVVTAEGRIVAGRVVLAINAWSLAVPELRPGILVITSDDAVTAPMPEFLQRHRWANGPILTDSAIFMSGYRPTKDGRIVAGVTGGAIGFGGLRGSRFEGPTPREGDIAQALGVAFRDAGPLEFVSSWRGPIDRTRSGLPVFGSLPQHPEILFGCGFSGNGIVGCRLGAKILTSLALNRADEWSTSGLVAPISRWMFPEPVRFFGAHLVRWAVRQKDRRDRQDSDQNILGRRLAALAPGGIVTTPDFGRRRKYVRGAPHKEGRNVFPADEH